MTARLHRIPAASDRSIPYFFSVIEPELDCLEEIMQSSSGSGKTADFEIGNLFHRLLAYVKSLIIKVRSPFLKDSQLQCT